MDINTTHAVIQITHGMVTLGFDWYTWVIIILLAIMLLANRLVRRH